MIGRFVIFTIIEEVLVVGLMAWPFVTHVTSQDLWSTVAAIAALCIGLAASNVAVFLQCRDRPWGSLRFSRRLRRTGMAIASTFAIFLTAFACLSIWFAMDLMTLLELSFMASLGIGAWALIGTELSRGNNAEVAAVRSDERNESNDSYPPTLRKVVDLIEEEADDAWLRQPRVLRKMLDSACRNDGKYSTEEVVSYLKGAVDKTWKDSGIAVTDVARWVDSLFADALVSDISWRVNDWGENIEVIVELLGATERRLSAKVLPRGADGLAFNVSGILGLGDRALLQRIQAYACIAESISGDEGVFRSKLEEALENVESNIDGILSQEDPSGFAMLESAVGWGCYEPHGRCWTAPLATLAHAAEAIGRERELMEVYERYVQFLKDRSISTNVLGGILMDAQITLSCLQGSPVLRECPVLPICI